MAMEMTMSEMPAEITLETLLMDAMPGAPQYQEDLQIRIYEELLTKARATQPHPLSYLGTMQQIAALQDQARELAREAGLPSRRALLLHAGVQNAETTTA